MEKAGNKNGDRIIPVAILSGYHRYPSKGTLNGSFLRMSTIRITKESI